MTTTETVDKLAFARDLERTRSAYHALLARLDDDVWRGRSGNPDLLVKEQMWHLAWAVGWLARAVDDARLGRRPAVAMVPRSVAVAMRTLAIRLLARRATPQRAAHAYDAGHHALVARLDLVRDDEWLRVAERWGEQRSVAWHFRQPVDHFAEHAADVEAAIARSRRETL